MEVLTKQLAQGWNPWVTDDESRGFVYFDKCLERYLDYVDRMDRKKTRQSYRSRVNILREFITSQVNPIKYAYNLILASVMTSLIGFILIVRVSTNKKQLQGMALRLGGVLDCS